MQRPTIRSTQSIIPTFQRVLDGLAILASLELAQRLLHEPSHFWTWTIATAGAAIFFLLGEVGGVYGTLQRRGADAEVATVSLSWGITFGALALIGFMTRVSDTFARSTVVAWFVLGGLFLLLGRMAFRVLMEKLVANGIGVRRCAIAGLNDLGIQTARNIFDHPGCGLQVVGFYDDRSSRRSDEKEAGLPPLCGGLEAMIDGARNGEFDMVLVALPMRAEQRIRDILKKLGDTPTAVYIVPDFFVFELLHSRWTDVGGLPVVSVFETPLYGVDGWIKRGVDLLLASLALLLLLPVLATVAILVRWSSPGPIFFLQKRYGLDGREFKVWKFRTMTVCDNGATVIQATRNDPRVTAIGRILRKTSIDELPQLVNVLDGSMSLVGPRPHATAHNEHFRKLIQGYMLRHKVKPGITGLAQVEGSRGETDTIEKMQQRIELDHRYIRDWSIWLDLKIMFRTVFVVLKQDAY